MGEIARHTVRIQKTVEDANLKLTHVVSDMRGTAHHRCLIELRLIEIEALDAAVPKLERHRATRSRPSRRRRPPDHHGGLSETVARILVAEISTDMRRFPTAGHPKKAITALAASMHRRLRHAV